MNFRINTLWLLSAAVLFPSTRVPAFELTSAMFRGQDFKQSIFGGSNYGYIFPKNQHWDPKKAPSYSRGYAEFAVHDFQLTPAMIYTINYGLDNLVRAHQTVFQRKVGPNFRVRFRIFGKYEDYAKYTQGR